jgi:hypothetical protein
MQANFHEHVLAKLVELQVLQFADTMRPPVNATLPRTYCHWVRNFDDTCKHLTPTHADMVAFLERWPDRDQATPSERNTLWHAQWQAGGGAAGPPPGPPTAKLRPEPAVTVPSADAVVQAAAGFADSLVVFLGAVPRMASSDDLPQFDDAHKQCHLYSDSPPKFNPVVSSGEPRQKWLQGTL